MEKQIVLDLQLQCFDTSTPEWRVFASALAEYGYSVFKGWLISGVVYEMAAQHGGGRGVLGLKKIPEGLRLRPDDAHAVAADLVIRSIAAFCEKTLMNPNPDKRWRPDGGASIKTFFVGRCLMELPDIYQRWARQENRFAGQGTHYAALDVDEHPGQQIDTESAGSAPAVLEELRRRNDKATMAMFELQMAGFSCDEIAEMLSSVGVTVTTAQVGPACLWRVSRQGATVEERAAAHGSHGGQGGEVVIGDTRGQEAAVPDPEVRQPVHRPAVGQPFAQVVQIARDVPAAYLLIGL